ncbi:AsmA protein [Endobacter medicaginis]|uniref:AsmA protein n=3 Tax=Endobacter medicaginis TaxID=1181271 RepID=A0A839UZZ1_9PROT|nr:AsmA family protein [Endobacter medicaginis]MBB3175346.1 AsmA protein [Endobacter medicaginis]MCX5476808.1 AsmA family protein [Endobacter medicaginis]
METFDRRRHRSWLAVLVALAVLAVVMVVAFGLVLRSRIDPKAVRMRLIAAVEHETGRHLTIGGPVTFHFLPRPEIAASAITLSNIDGGVAPEMLSVRAAEADIAILPLLKREVRLSRLTLYAPQVNLERRPDGVWNWTFTRASPPPDVLRPTARPGQVAAHTHSHGQAWSIGLDHLRVEGGSVTVLDRDTGGADRTTHIDLRDLNADAVSSSQPAWRLRVLRGGLPVTIEARTGPLTAVTQGWPSEPWPLRVMVLQDNGTGTSASMRAVGTLSGGKTRGFDLDLHASVPDLAALQPLVDGVTLPQMQAAALATRINGALGPFSGGDWRLTVSSLHAQTGPTVIGGLHLLAGSVDAAAATAPVAVHLALHNAPTPLSLTARLGTLAQVEPVVAAVLTQAGPRPTEAAKRWIAGMDAVSAALSAPMPVSVSLESGRTSLSLDGQFDKQAGELHLKATTPDLQTVWPGAPHLTDATLSALLKESPGGHLSVDDLVLHGAEGDLSGRAGLGWSGDRAAAPQFSANLRSTRLDTDALRQDTRADPHAGLLTPQAAAPAPGPAPSVPAVSPGTATSAGAPGGLDRTLPFERLHEFDGGLIVQIDKLIASGATYQDVGLHAALAGGRLVVDPFSMQAPQGPVSGSLTADSATRAVSLVLHAPSIPVGSLAAFFPGWAAAMPGVRGTLQVEADLRGSGDTPHALLGTLGGTLGLSSVDGSIPNALLSRWVQQLGGGGGGDGRAGGKSGNALSGLARGLSSGLARIESGGDTALRCFASAAHIDAGLATLDPIAFDTSRLSATGHGTLRLDDDTLDLHLMSSVLLGGTGASTPVHLSGTPGTITVAMDPGLPGGRFGIVIGGAAPADPCPAALAAARFGQAGPEAAARKTGGKAADVLRGLGLLR